MRVPTCTPVVLSVLFFAVSALALSGSDACLASDCQGVLLQCSACSFALQTSSTLDTEQSTCICYAEGFTGYLDECIECMEPYDQANFTRSTWDSLCPADAFSATPTGGPAASSSLGEPVGPEDIGTSPVQTQDPSAKISEGEVAGSGADGRAGCVVSGLLVAVGVVFLGMV